MKLVVFSLLATAAYAATLYDAPRPQTRAFDSAENVAILRDERLIDDEGKYNFDFETANGISVSESGAPVGEDGAVNSAGSFSYTAPDGTPVHVEFVADEKGFQPQSDLLPVAPAFPHPIPQFVLDQIAFAAEEDAARARGELREVSQPSSRYGAP
ncbi:cuticle protein AMP1A-like [Penaeus monodon]|uniref:cuticle protein AMP1A-like n=1 Tax=Penaeus monodon TaxID=6687 RepID=UPI0018A71E7B|nr:cuticle protein AMP1A-like [Penaeus monodon]